MYSLDTDSLLFKFQTLGENRFLGLTDVQITFFSRVTRIW